MIILLVCGKNTTFAENKQYASISFPYTSLPWAIRNIAVFYQSTTVTVIYPSGILSWKTCVGTPFLEKGGAGDRDR